jgi:hypothetical protein
MPARSIALGVRTHSGWAAVVAVAAGPDGISIAHRGRLELVVPGPDAVRQPYHEAEGRPVERARRIVADATELAARLAAEGLAGIAERVGSGGRVEVCGLLLSSGRPLPGFEAILASHAAIHAAEGELFRDAIRSATAARKWALVAAPEKDIWARAAAAVGRPAAEVRKRVAALGKSVGPPWTQDEKLATAAALLALSEAGGSRPAL